MLVFLIFFFFFNQPPTTEIYTLSLHDALPISIVLSAAQVAGMMPTATRRTSAKAATSRFMSVLLSVMSRSRDRKSTRLNSSHLGISYAVFCLKKKKKININNDVQEYTQSCTEK